MRLMISKLLRSATALPRYLALGVALVILASCVGTAGNGSPTTLPTAVTNPGATPISAVAAAARLAVLRTLSAASVALLSLAISPDGQTLAAGGRDGTVRLWRVSDGAPLPTLTLPGGPAVTGLAFASDGRTLAAAGVAADGTGPGVLTWQLPAGTAGRVFQGPAGIYAVAF